MFSLLSRLKYSQKRQKRLRLTLRLEVSYETDSKKSLVKTKKEALSTKKQFDLNEFRRSFESLDSENYGSWPLPVKVTVIGFIIALIAALSWALPISSKIDEINAAESQQQTLLDSYREKNRVHVILKPIKRK